MSLMIEPLEVDNLQITVSQGIKTSAPHDNSCDGCNFLLLALSSMKVMSHSHRKVVLIPFNSCDATFIDDRDSRSPCTSWLTMTMTTHVMQLSLMIEPIEVDNLQITVSQGIKTSAPHDNSCDGCNFLLLALSSMKVMHLSTYVMV